MNAQYAEASRDVQMFLEGRRSDLTKSLEDAHGAGLREQERYEEAAGYRDRLRTLARNGGAPEDRCRRGRRHRRDRPGMPRSLRRWPRTLFHLRGGRVIDRRDYTWEDLDEVRAQLNFLPSLLKQLYLDAAYIPHFIHTPMDFEDRELLESVLADRAGHRVEILHPRARKQLALPGIGRGKRQALPSISASAS